MYAFECHLMTPSIDRGNNSSLGLAHMKRWLWFSLSLLISTGVYFTIRYGLRPKPIPVMNATEFSNMQEIGAVVYRRLRQEIRNERVVLLGSSPELADYEEVWSGLLKTALADQVKVTVLFQKEGLHPPAGGAWQTISFDENMVRSGELLNAVKQKMQAGDLVVIQAPSTEVSHLIKDSLSRELDTASGRPVLSISSLDVSLTNAEQNDLQAQCLSAQELASRIDCAEARVGKNLLKKKMTSGKIVAVLERHGLKEYLLFVHPGSTL
jgi:hypothetical protein